MKYLCECNKTFCKKTIDLSTEEYQVILNKGLIIIVNDHQPEPGEELAIARKDYKLYRKTAEGAWY